MIYQAKKQWCNKQEINGILSKKPVMYQERNNGVSSKKSMVYLWYEINMSKRQTVLRSHLIDNNVINNK